MQRIRRHVLSPMPLHLDKKLSTIPFRNHSEDLNEKLGVKAPRIERWDVHVDMYLRINSSVLKGDGAQLCFRPTVISPSLLFRILIVIILNAPSSVKYSRNLSYKVINNKKNYLLWYGHTVTNNFPGLGRTKQQGTLKSLYFTNPHGELFTCKVCTCKNGLAQV